MECRSLTNVDINDLTNCFNFAFSDYIIPMHLETSQLKDRFYAAGIDYSLSFGAFDSQHRLVAFIMHCTDHSYKPSTVFNVGTGVIPDYRGQRLIAQLYNYASPILLASGIKTRMLEVIQSNDKAIRAYQSVGFEIAREFHSFKGRVQPPEKHVQKGLIAYASPEEFSQLDHPSFWSFQPSWENSIESIHRNIQAYTIYFIQDNDKTCGYAVVHSATGLIKQFGVLHEKRRQGYGTTLFKAISKQHSEIKIINIDKIDTVTLEFLNKIGLVDYIQQFEMHAANV